MQSIKDHFAPWLEALGERSNSPSLDRIDNSKSYVKGNVKVISYKANILKGNGSIEELSAVVRYMENERLEQANLTK